MKVSQLILKNTALSTLILLLCVVAFNATFTHAQTGSDEDNSEEVTETENTDTDDENTNDSSATADEIECSERPFATKADREKVKEEDPDCYELRTGDQGTDDAQGLQDTGAQQSQPNFSGFGEGINTLLQILSQIRSGSRDSGGGVPPTQVPTTENPTVDTNDPETREDPGLAPALYFEQNVPTASSGNGEVAVDEYTIPIVSLASRDTDSDTAQELEFERTSDNYQNDLLFNERKRGFLTSLFSRPSVGQPASRLAPNLYTDVQDAADLFGVTSSGPVSTPNAVAADNYTALFPGFYSPVQNLVLGVSNGLLALLQQAVAE